MKRLLSLLVVAVMLLQSVSTIKPVDTNAAVYEGVYYIELGLSDTIGGKIFCTGKKVKWKSADKSIVTVKKVKDNDNYSICKITAKKAGSTVITQTKGKQKYKFKITVVDSTLIYDKKDVETLRAIIKDQNKQGAGLDVVLDSNSYKWEEGKLVSIDCHFEHLSGKLSTAGLDNLEYLDCSSNNLKQLDVSKNVNLEYLYCDRNNLKQLDVSKNVNLVKLVCYENKLKKLDVSKNVNLKELCCEDNKLTKLDVSKNVNLTSLDCRKNQLT
ncbi:MAG: hypothetical protein K6E29_08145, partial [Cyanobacteria bacterium RUI128]|nr:hypothetical protein [Cyanobacteria bacterium RUI128]